ncbi:MAG: S-methyl-5-thioribose-1-phosphate isomerase, partial [Halieaceae bacterium]|nr:S-methyl-5-thioribose-1-phosphate isomerase [Halieaceae bacterium]
MQAPDTLTSLRWDPVLARVEVIDQTLLPHRLQWQPLETLQSFCHAIRAMQVRGAPLIGITAAFGLAQELARDASDQNLEAAVAALLQTRPTAVNLGWALQQVRQAVAGLEPGARAGVALQRALELREQ